MSKSSLKFSFFILSIYRWSKKKSCFESTQITPTPCPTAPTKSNEENILPWPLIPEGKKRMRMKRICSRLSGTFDQEIRDHMVCVLCDTCHYKSDTQNVSSLTSMYVFHRELETGLWTTETALLTTDDTIKVWLQDVLKKHVCGYKHSGSTMTAVVNP